MLWVCLSPGGKALKTGSVRGGAVAARLAHNQKVVGSNPTPATNSGSLQEYKYQKEHITARLSS